MSDELTDFARPVLRGSRFDDHAIPVDTLKEFAKYHELVFLVARRLYWDRTKAAKVPTGFKDCFQLKLRDVEHNCATPVLSIPSGLSPELLEAGVLGDFEHARDLVARTIQAAKERTRLPEEFPVEFLEKLEFLGASLREDETIELRGPSRDVPGPVYDHSTRMYLKAVRTRPSYVEMADITGTVISFKDNGHFEIRRREGEKPLTCRGDNSHEAKVLAALKGRRHLRVRVVGQTKYNGDGVAEEVQQILTLDVWSRTSEADMKQLEGRIGELAALQPGWLDGEGEALSVRGLNWLQNHILVWLMADQGLPRPLLYAMPEGGVQAVWRPLPWRVEAEFDLGRRTVSLLAVNIDTDEDADAEIALDTQEGEKELFDFIAKYVPRVDKQPFRRHEEGQ